MFILLLIVGIAIGACIGELKERIDTKAYKKFKDEQFKNTGVRR